MCGPKTTNRPPGGAVTALRPSNSNHALHPLAAELVFYTPGKLESCSATRMRLTPTGENGPTSLPKLHVIIQ